MKKFYEKLSLAKSIWFQFISHGIYGFSLFHMEYIDSIVLLISTYPPLLISTYPLLISTYPLLISTYPLLISTYPPLLCLIAIPRIKFCEVSLYDRIAVTIALDEIEEEVFGGNSACEDIISKSNKRIFYALGIIGFHEM